MLDRNNLRDVISRLEALEALTKLFNTLWFDQIKEDIKDEKIQAYLVVFEDAFPSMNHVLNFARRSVELLSDDDVSRRQWESLEAEFTTLHQLLTGAPAMADRVRVAAQEPDATDLTTEEKDLAEERERLAEEALAQAAALEEEVVDDIGSLVPEDASHAEDDIDVLFDGSDAVDVPADDDAELAGLLEEVKEEDVVGDDVELEALLEGDSEAEDTETHNEDVAELLSGDDEGIDDDVDKELGEDEIDKLFG